MIGYSRLVCLCVQKFIFMKCYTPLLKQLNAFLKNKLQNLELVSLEEFELRPPCRLESVPRWKPLSIFPFDSLENI
jgi:hypothetical protein